MIKINAKELFTPFKLINTLMDEVTLNFTKDGLSIESSDRCMHYYVSFLLKCESFEVYDIEPRKVKLSLVEFEKIRKAVSSDDMLTLDFREGDYSIGNGTESWTHSLLAESKVESDNEAVSKNVEHIEKDLLNIHVTLPFAELKKAIDHAGDLTDDNRKLCLDKKGDYLTVSLNRDNNKYKNTIQVFKSEGEGISSYGIEMLTELVKHSITDEVTLDFGTDKPLFVKFQTDKMLLKVVLAPRVVDDSE